MSSICHLQGISLCLCVFLGCGTVITVTPYRGAVMVRVAPDYISTLLCYVTHWSWHDDVIVHRASTTANGLQRWSEWVCVSFVTCSQTGCVCTGMRVMLNTTTKDRCCFHGLVLRDSLSGSVLFKSIMNSLTHVHTLENKQVSILQYIYVIC